MGGNFVITTGKNVEQALEKALKQLNLKKDNVDIEILEETQGALFGLLGGKSVKIRVSRRERGPVPTKPESRGGNDRRGSSRRSGGRTDNARSSREPRGDNGGRSRGRRNGSSSPRTAPAGSAAVATEGLGAENVELLEQIVSEVLGYMGVDYSVTIEEVPDTTFINISSEGLDGLLIGRRGETLASLQHVVNRIFTARTGHHSKITVDVGGYVRRKHRLLVEKARKVAERVRKTQKDYDFEPLKAADRRIIHLAVADIGDITTYTIGDGLLRKVVISPKSTSSRDA